MSKNPAFTGPYVEAYAVPHNASTAGFITTEAINEGGAREFLTAQKWPIGLQDTLVEGLHKVPIRFFICDDSGSMGTNDGNRIVSTGKGKKMIECTRWAELTTSLEFHMQLARAANAPTEFRLLNGAEPILLGNAQAHDVHDAASYTSLQAVLKDGPRGGTPLCKHISEVIQNIRQMEQQLRSNRQLACVVIATDGESSDGDVAQAMAPLKSLPVWVVIRLCTDNDQVVNYWNRIDSQLELDMDVLDDFKGEAQEVQEKNSWLTYGEPLHRLREFGIIVKEFDFLDEVLLSLDQMKKICLMIYGHHAKSFPPPDADLDGFVKALSAANKSTLKEFSPITSKEQEWIIPKKVMACYGKPGGCTIG